MRLCLTVDMHQQTFVDSWQTKLQQTGAVRIVYNGGPENVMEGRERSCLFYWEQSLHIHTKQLVLRTSKTNIKSYVNHGIVQEVKRKQQPYIEGFVHGGQLARFLTLIFPSSNVG